MTFTPQGKLLSWDVFEKDGRPQGTRALYSYNRAGRLTSIVDYSFGSLSYTETLTYPRSRRVKITRVFELHNGKSSNTEIDDYDSNGNIIKAVFREENGYESSRELFKYDDKGNLTEFKAYGGDGKIYLKETYQYEYDSYGNWTTQRAAWSVPGPLTGITTHKITYY